MSTKSDNISQEELEEYFQSSRNKLTLSLGQCQILRRLGKGGNGLVYKAKIFEKDVAIKFLLSKDNGKLKNQRLKRFHEEYINIINLDDQKNIVRYLDFDQLLIDKVKVPLIIMKLYEGSLNNENKNQITFLKLFDFLINTLEKLHHNGIIHRDLKPENILMDKNEFILADFGVADFNPDIFTVLAETGTGERIANRLFSAPEQENLQEPPKVTMDFFAIGQILQWYATGATHRGTGRTKITTIFPGLNIYDDVIEICLRQVPSERFQSVQGIRYFIKSRQEPRIDHYEYMILFDRLCCKNFPKRERNIAYSDNIERIDNFMSDLKQNLVHFKSYLWWFQGRGNLSIEEIEKKGNGTWKINTYEYDIKEIWIHGDETVNNTFVLFHYNKGKPFPEENENEFHAIIVDDKDFITTSEYDNAWMETTEGTSPLSEHKVEVIHRQEASGYFFICSTFNNLSDRASDMANEAFIEYLIVNGKIPSIEEVSAFANKISRNRHHSLD